MSKDLPEPEKFVDSLAMLAKGRGRSDLLGLLNDAEARYDHIDQDWGVDYYRLLLSVSFSLYASIESQLDSIESFLTDLAKKASRACSNEGVSSVTVVPNFDASDAWRTGARPVTVPSSEAERLWGGNRFRLFLSHESAYKGQVAKLKEALALRNVEAFVAHNDIEPSRAWQNEIEFALASCHAMAALVTPDFHSSVWCMQEVGWGLARGILVQPVKLPSDPRGFYGSLQAFPGQFEKPREIRDRLVRILASNSKTSSYIQEPLVSALEGAKSSRMAEIILGDLEASPTLSAENAKRIRGAAMTNVSIKGDKALAESIRRLTAQLGESPVVEDPLPDEYDPFAED